MRVEELDSVKPEVAQRLKELYGVFTLEPDGRPKAVWEDRWLKKVRFGVQFRHAAFPDFYLKWIRVNRRMVPAIQSVFNEVAVRWTHESQTALGINLYSKCYCFGDGDGPNLHWYGAAWQLSPKLKGEALRDLVKIFIRYGFTPQEDNERTLEYW
jgi:hypothetical protein